MQLVPVQVDTPTAPAGGRVGPVLVLAPPQAHNDKHLVSLWLRSQRSEHTRRSYLLDAYLFVGHINRPLASVTLGDLQAFADTQSHLSASSLSCRLSSIKSLLSFGHRLGYLPINAGVAVRLPPVKDTLAERIMCEADVHALIAAAQSVRDRVMLRLMYATGLRISEACSLKSRDLRDTCEDTGCHADREAGCRGGPMAQNSPSAPCGSITVFGKGGKTRSIAVGGSLWADLRPFRSVNPDAPLFVSRQGNHLAISIVHRIVKACAVRAGLSEAISCHWLRHAHVSHALDHGAPVHLVQRTVGHASLATTSRYAHALPSMSSAAYLSA